MRTTTAAPAPRVLAIESDPTVLGTPFLLMERHDGRTLADDPPFAAAGWLLLLATMLDLPAPTAGESAWIAGSR